MKKTATIYILLAISFFSLIITSCSKKTVEPIITPPVVVTDSLKVGLLAWYTFNNTGADSSGNANHGLVYNINSTSDRNGKTNSAYYFDGATSYIQVKDNQALRLNNTDFTINTWMRIDGYNASYGSILLTKRGSASSSGWSYGIHGITSGVPTPVGQTTYQVSGGTDPFAAGVKQLTTGTWYMLTTEYSLQKQQISFYINGVLDNTINNITTPNAVANNDIFIGRDNPVLGNGYFFKGAIDDTRIYNRLLSTNLIQKLYSNTN